MHAGILIVGSLLWRQSPERERWRQARLLVAKRISVEAPIYYGRLSKNGTYTMTFGGKEEMGRAALVPCKAPVIRLEDLLMETQAIWTAECPTAKTGSVGTSWGCVGVAFRDGKTSALAAAWRSWFRKSGTAPIAPVDAEGILEIEWPADATPSGVEIILATATFPVRPRVSAKTIADAWINEGGEEYFFQNIAHGIRTRDDLAIWARMVEWHATCLTKREYAPAVEKLQAEDAGGAE